MCSWTFRCFAVEASNPGWKIEAAHASVCEEILKYIFYFCPWRRYNNNNNNNSPWRALTSWKKTELKNKFPFLYELSRNCSLCNNNSYNIIIVPHFATIDACDRYHDKECTLYKLKSDCVHATVAFRTWMTTIITILKNRNKKIYCNKSITSNCLFYVFYVHITKKNRAKIKLIIHLTKLQSPYFGSMHWIRPIRNLAPPEILLRLQKNVISWWFSATFGCS